MNTNTAASRPTFSTIATLLYERDFTLDKWAFLYMEGSIARYIKCTVYPSPVWGDIAGAWFVRVRYESFCESGQPEVDHHTINEMAVAVDALPDFLKEKGILTNAERDARHRAFRDRVYRGRG